MSSRFLSVALVVGAIVLACGPRARNEAFTPRKSTTLVTRATTKVPLIKLTSSKAGHGDHKPAIVAELYVHASDAKVRFALHLVNTSKKRVELIFPSGQTYDFVVLDTLGREMWRWANGRMFTQALRNKLLSGGEELDLEETWTAATLSPGKYTARAILTSANYPIVQQTEFTINGTTVASR